jgi:SAM-dependent methyltransferase
VDSWKFFDITHRDHVLCNPTSTGKLDEVIDLLDLPARARILEVACGKGELLLRTIERYGGPAGHGMGGVAIDLSPFCVRDVRAQLSRRAPAAAIEVLEMNAADYRPTPASFDLTVCLGASWIHAGHAGTLRFLQGATRPGGQILVGEPYWIREPDPAYLQAAGFRADEFGTHAGNVQSGVDAGLEPLLALASNGDEWDRYETLQWRAAARWASANPTDPDVATVLERVERSRREYLTWGRDTLGWALYLFRRPAAP